MASYSSSTYQSGAYNTFRPHYPASFYETLSKYTNSKLDKVTYTIDLGCGTGVATYDLLKISEKVVGLDISPVMIKTANDLLELKGEEDVKRIQFEVCSTEDFLPNGTKDVSLITAAECIHWFSDYPLFFEESAKKLQPNGVLAYWCYIEPFIVSFTGESKKSKKETLLTSDDIYNKFIFEDPEWLGPHWQQPGKEVIRGCNDEATRHIPNDLFTDVVVNRFDPRSSDPNPDRLDIVRNDISLEQYMAYIGTFSALDKYAGADKKKKEDFLEKFLKEFEEELGWDRKTTKVDLVWSTGYVFMTKA